jgi:hypothetical protein
MYFEKGLRLNIVETLYILEKKLKTTVNSSTNIE